MWMPMHRRPSYLTNKRKRPQATPSFLLPVPKTKKLKCENKLIADLEIGHASMQGYRVSMEDEHIIDSMTGLPDHALVAIMDGHAGSFSAEFVSVHLKNKIEETEEWKEYSSLTENERITQVGIISKALVQAYIHIDEDLRGLKECGIMDESGCTLVCTIITPSHIVCANVGDSRCVLGQKSKVVALTEDHKPSIIEEKIRIEKAGGFVRFDRVNGELAMSRAIGDFRYKMNATLELHEHLVICLPDISIQERNKHEDETLILACDGVWDVISNEEAIHYVSNIVLKEESGFNSDDSQSGENEIGFNLRRKIRRQESDDSHVSSQEAAESLIDLALKDGSTDNISAIVVRFSSQSS